MRVRHTKRDAKLSLDEQLVLLALDVSFGPESAKIYSKSLDVGVAGAILFLLLRNGGVTINGNYVNARGPYSLGGGELDVLLKVWQGKVDLFKAHRIGAWILRIAKLQPHLAVIAGLERKGILATRKRKKVLLKPEVREQLVKRLRQVIREGNAADEETAALIGLAHACQCLDEAEFGEELRLHKAQLEALGTREGPLPLWVRTAVADQKMRNSLRYLYYAGGSVVGALIAGQCSS